MWNLIYFVAMTILTSYLDSKQKVQEPEAISEEDFNTPSIDHEREIPIMYGTNKISGFNVLVTGDFSNFEIKKKVSAGLFSSKKITTAIGYRIGLINGFGFGGTNKEIQLLKFLVDDDLLYSSSSVGSFSASVDNKSFFGDYEEAEGGMSGSFSFYSGSDNQVIDSYALTITDGKAPAWNGLSYLVWKGGYIGNTGGLAPWSFVLKRIPKFTALNAAYNEIDGGCNPAVIILDLLIDRVYGAAIDSNLIDYDNFRTVQKKLFDEGWGMNILLNSKGSIKDRINEITTKIDGNLSFNTTTGKYYIHLNRQDYIVENLEVFDESKIVSVSNFSKNTFSSLVNQCKVKYTDINDNFQQKQVSFKDAGLIYEMAKGETLELDYSVISNKDLAYRIAIRELLPISSNLFKCDISVNRYAYDLSVGDVIILSLSKQKIERIVMRVVEIIYGSISDPTMTLSLVQDKFGFEYDVYYKVAENSGSFVDFKALPADLKLLEAPYYFTNDTDTLSKAIAYASKPSSTHIDFKLLTKQSSESSYLESEPASFSPNASLFSAINTQSSSIQLTAGIDLNSVSNETDDDLVSGSNLSIIIEGSKHEFISFRTISTNTNGYILNNVKRGLLDTIPQDFSSAAKLYVIDYGYAINRGSFSGTLNAKIITRTLKDNLENTTVYSLTSSNRREKPIAPSNLKINNTAFLNTMTVSATQDLTISYNTRDKKRIIQFYTDTSTSNVDNVTYRIRIYDNTNNTLVKSVDTQELNYTFSDELTINSGVRFSSLRVEIDAVASSVASAFKYSIIVNR